MPPFFSWAPISRARWRHGSMCGEFSNVWRDSVVSDATRFGWPPAETGFRIPICDGVRWLHHTKGYAMTIAATSKVNSTPATSNQRKQKRSSTSPASSLAAEATSAPPRRWSRPSHPPGADRQDGVRHASPGLHVRSRHGGPPKSGGCGRHDGSKRLGIATCGISNARRRFLGIAAKLRSAFDAMLPCMRRVPFRTRIGAVDLWRHRHDGLASICEADQPADAGRQRRSTSGRRPRSWS